MKKITIPDSFEDKSYHAAMTAAEDVKKQPDTPQTRSHAYSLSFQDPEFLLKDEMRSVRLMLEFEKPEILQKWHRIESTIRNYCFSKNLSSFFLQIFSENQFAIFEQNPRSRSPFTLW